jgi:hypothetical protein
MDVWVFGFTLSEEEVLLLAQQPGTFGGPGRILTIEASEEPMPPGIHVGGRYNLRFSPEGVPGAGECIDVLEGGVYRFSVPLAGPPVVEKPPAPAKEIVEPSFEKDDPNKKRHEREIAEEEERLRKLEEEIEAQLKGQEEREARERAEEEGEEVEPELESEPGSEFEPEFEPELELEPEPDPEPELEATAGPEGSEGPGEGAPSGGEHEHRELPDKVQDMEGEGDRPEEDFLDD